MILNLHIYRETEKLTKKYKLYIIKKSNNKKKDEKMLMLWYGFSYCLRICCVCVYLDDSAILVSVYFFLLLLPLPMHYNIINLDKINYYLSFNERERETKNWATYNNVYTFLSSIRTSTIKKKQLALFEDKWMALFLLPCSSPLSLKANYYFVSSCSVYKSVWCFHKLQ